MFKDNKSSDKVIQNLISFIEDLDTNSKKTTSNLGANSKKTTSDLDTNSKKTTSNSQGCAKCQYNKVLQLLQ